MPKLTFIIDQEKDAYNGWVLCNINIPYNENKFRKTIGRYPSEKCNSCNESCSGGCPLFWLKFNSDKEIRGIKND